LLVRGSRTVPDLILLDGVIPAAIPRRSAASSPETRPSRACRRRHVEQGEDLEARFARAPNVVDYISKPFSPDALQAVVSHVVESRGGAPCPRRARGRPAPGDAREPGRRRRGALALVGPETTATVLGGFALAGDLAVVSLGEILSMLKDGGSRASCASSTRRPRRRSSSSSRRAASTSRAPWA